MINLDNYLDDQMILKSRIHPLKTFPNGCYVKRDDELSFGISGSKYRKYSSLIHYLQKAKINKVALVGSSFSNHILGMVQLLIEKEIDYHLYLLKSHEHRPVGNLGLIHLFSNPCKIDYLDHDQWHLKDDIIPKMLGENDFYIPEGGSCFESLYGSISLAFDIASNEKSISKTFDTIFIDAGTGFSACGLLLGLSLLEKKPHVYIIQLYHEPSKFLSNLAFFKNEIEKRHNISLSLPPFTLHRSMIGASFGSVSEKIFDEITFYAKKEGFLLDPIYSAKLFATAKSILSDHCIESSSLIIHSGGALTLMGFQEQLFSKILM